MNLPKISNCLIEPYYPYYPPYVAGPYETWIGDFPRHRPRDTKDNETYQKGWAKILEGFRNPVLTETILDKQVWFNNSDGGQTFRLEVVGYGKEHISAEIKESVLYISAKRNQKGFNQKYEIPSPEKLDLGAITAKVEYGLLEIIFPEKKTEVKSIKVL